MSIKKDQGKIPATLIKSANPFPVVGIGASAGGLDAFKRLLKAVPENSGMAFVLVQHLDPNHESLLADLLQKVTSIPVLEISDDIKVEPDHIYIIPSNKMLIASDGILKLSPRPTKNKKDRNLPIDLFFSSLAEVHQSHAIGVVLSGTASDGTAGLKAIKDQGGLTFAQDEASAAFIGMPHSAAQAGVVDFILPPEKIPEKILEINKTISDAIGNEKNASSDEEVYKQILSLLRVRKGTDFAYYKQTTIRRRILRRMVLNSSEVPSSYLDFLRENKSEQDALYQDLLIPVTSFFRDSKIFNELCKSIFPLIIKGKAVGESIRVWVAGCSTGEEAYSLAMCFIECLGENSKKVQIFATDISDPAIIKARTGIYTANEVKDVSQSRLKEFFVKKNDTYHVNKPLRDICVFASHNFLKDPPFGKMDFISCRNVLIYMEPYLQKRALTTFHYALNGKGFLLLGRTESANCVRDLFTLAKKTEKIFARNNVPVKYLHLSSPKSEGTRPRQNLNVKTETPRANFQKIADDIVLSKYAPAGVIVNEAMEINHFRGNTSSYLEQLSGEPTHNLIKMARDGLGFELRTLLLKAKKVKERVSKENVSFKINGRVSIISLEAIPLTNTPEPYYLILFHETGTGEVMAGNKRNKRQPAKGKNKKDDRDIRIRQLEQELAQTHEDMRGITDDQEATNEELQSDNEELLSSSEELQSLNEELETSKEELQSTNEELLVVNQEMVTLNEQLKAARDYSEAIVATTREPLLVLDKNLRIKTANRSFYETFPMTPRETEGKLIFDIGDKQWDILSLRNQLEKVLPENESFFDFEVTHHSKSLGTRYTLLNAREMPGAAIDEKLILLAIEDITDKATAQKKIEESNKRNNMMLMQSPFAFSVMMGKDMVITIANNLMKEFWGKGQQVEGKTLAQVLPELMDQPFPAMMDRVYTTGNPVYANESLARLMHNGKLEDRYFNVIYQPYIEMDDTISGVITIAHEVTDQVKIQKKMQAQADMVTDLLLTAPAFIATLAGPDHVYELVNERYQQLFGKRKIQGKPIMVALPELKGQGFDTILDNVYNTGETYVGIDIPITLGRDENQPPELSYFNFSYQPMYDENENIFSILVFGYEVTQQVVAKNKIAELQKLHSDEMEGKVELRTSELSHSNELLERKNEELELMNKELDSFTYVSSHDLQEPLRKIQAFADVIIEKESENLTANGKDYFKRMQLAAARMQLLIEDLLVFARLNKAERKFENTDLTKIVKEVENDLKDVIAEKKAVIKITELCDAYIIPFQFHQLLYNLISNALKFSKPQVPPYIVIESTNIITSKENERHLTPGLEYCHITVKDNGIGFEQHFSKRIFEVFQRLNGRDEFVGTGIGLAIVKKIVDNHNGIITATSELDKGAAFDIYIPVSPHI